jgi:hypothetical protein
MDEIKTRCHSKSEGRGEEGGRVYFVLRMYSKREREQGDSVPYTVKISSVAVVDQIRCCPSFIARPKRDVCEIQWLGWWGAVGWSETGKETSLEDNEKEPEVSWDSRGEMCYDQ